MEQSLNFEMLRSQWPELAELACMAERYVHSDPEKSSGQAAQLHRIDGALVVSSGAVAGRY